MITKFFEKILSKVKFYTIARLLRIHPHFFFDLVVYHFSKFFRGNVDDKLIILGGNYAKYFGGNTKYLYIYLKENTDYQLFWMSKSLELNKKLEKQGIKTIYAYTLKAIKMLRRARAVFVTHGTIDVLPIKFSPRTVHVQTWHGGDIKIIGNNPYAAKYIYSKWAKLLRLKLRDHEYVDFLVSQSRAKRPLEILSEAFRYPLERIIPTGYPRNDIFFSKEKDLKVKLRMKYNIPSYINKILLYAPTFRPDFEAKFPLNNENLVKLNQYLLETKYLFLMKGHIKERTISFKDLENIKTIGLEADTQELLYITDILITDYSSIYCDFLLLNRPVLLFTYDYKKYEKERGFYYDHLEEIAPGPLIYTGEELINTIKNIQVLEKQYESKRLELRDYFNAYNDGKSSERLLRFLKLIE